MKKKMKSKKNSKGMIRKKARIPESEVKKHEDLVKEVCECGDLTMNKDKVCDECKEDKELPEKLIP